MGAIRLESGFEDPRDATSLMSGHVDYFEAGSTSAQNIREVIRGTRSVSLFVEYEVVSVGGRTIVTSPVEASPEDYTGTKLRQVRVRTLEE